MGQNRKTLAAWVLLLAFALFVAACNDAHSLPPPASDGNGEVSSPGDADVNGEGGGIGEADGDTDASGANAGEPGEDGRSGSDDPAMGEPPAETKEVEIEVEGMKETRTGTLAVSDNGYYLYVIPPFVFTPEEPGADVIYVESFPDYSMRIQVLPTDTDLTLIRENAEEELKSISGSFEELKGDDIYDPFLRNAEFYLQSIDEEMVKNIIVMNIDGRLIRFTMFLPVGGEASEGAVSGFIAMMKTIRAHE